MLHSRFHQRILTLLAFATLAVLTAAPALATVCPADVTGDNAVDTPDLDFVQGCWGPVSPGSFCAVVDFDDSNTIDGSDITFVLASWGPCPTASCPWDLNEDDQVVAADRDMLLACWGPVNAGSVCAGADFDDSGVIDGTDLTAILSNWGPCP